MKGRRILVTGCSGLLGSWLCRELVERGSSVVGLDRDYRAGSIIHEVTDRMDLIMGDIENLELMTRVVNEYEIEYVYHFAAQAIVGAAARNPISTFKSNIEGTWNVLESCRVLRMNSDRLKGVMVASSDKCYGDQEILPYVEDAPMQGRYPYDVSKSCADLIARSYYHSYGLPVCVTRCGNMYGGGDLNFSRIVPKTIRSALKDERITIRSDGSLVRDYIYIDDVVEACIMLGEHMMRDTACHGESFNISNEAPLSVLEIVRKMLDLLGRPDLEPVVEGRATLEIQKQYLDSSKVRRMVGWEPKYDIDTGLKETIEWYRHYLGLEPEHRLPELVKPETTKLARLRNANRYKKQSG